MSWLSNLFGSNPKSNGVENQMPLAEIPEDVFIEKNSPIDKPETKEEDEVSQDNIHMVYA